MLIKILFSGESCTGRAFTVAMRTHFRGFGASMLIMDFALVAEETTGVGEALDFVAAGFEADVGAGVFIHVFSVSNVLARFEEEE
jgi:hypothetical protein